MAWHDGSAGVRYVKVTFPSAPITTLWLAGGNGRAPMSMGAYPTGGFKVPSPPSSVGNREPAPCPSRCGAFVMVAVMVMTFVEAEALSARIVGMYAPDRLVNRWGEVIRAFPHRPKGSSQWRVRYHIEYPSGVPAWGEVENPSFAETLQSRPEGKQNDV